LETALALLHRGSLAGVFPIADGNDSGKAKRLPRGVCEAWAMALALAGSIADAAGLKGDGPATDLATDLATHRGSLAGVSPIADAMTAADANACHGPSVSDGAGGLKGACAQPDPATHSASLAGILPTADAMTPATQNACHGPSVSLETRGAMATHRGSLAGVFPIADAMTPATPATQNACHGPSVSLETRGAMATHRGSLAGVFPIADAMTPATVSASHGPSVRRWQATGPGNRRRTWRLRWRLPP
jgi:hypothetical protein